MPGITKIYQPRFLTAVLHSDEPSPVLVFGPADEERQVFLLNNPVCKPSSVNNCKRTKINTNPEHRRTEIFRIGVVEGVVAFAGLVLEIRRIAVVVVGVLFAAEVEALKVNSVEKWLVLFHRGIENALRVFGPFF